MTVHSLARYRDVFAGVEPWSGHVPKGYLVDFLGTLTDARFRSTCGVVFQSAYGVDPATAGGGYAHTTLPPIGNGLLAEDWFEAANWFTAAREARGRYVMIDLGACYGVQAVRAWRVLQLVNPMDCMLVAVEPVPEHYQWMLQHFRNNGIDPDAHWLLPLVTSGGNEPVFFPMGSPGTGSQNCYSTNSAEARQQHVETLTAAGGAARALRELILYNRTGIIKNIVHGHDAPAEIKLVSAVTLRDLLGPFDVVDYIESDIQQSEVLVFPPYVDLLEKKVRRIHIATHGIDAHRELRELFAKRDWEMVFDFEPETTHHSDVGDFQVNDGVLTVRNPRL